MLIMRNFGSADHGLHEECPRCQFSPPPPPVISERIGPEKCCPNQIVCVLGKLGRHTSYGTEQTSTNPRTRWCTSWKV